jgi:hypothetical protein
MNRSDPIKVKEFRSWLRRYLKETNDPRAQFAMGYRRAQSNYYDKNVQKDFKGYSESFIKGYKSGIKDARYGKFNDTVLKILTAIGSQLGNWNIGNRSDKY